MRHLSVGRFTVLPPPVQFQFPFFLKDYFTVLSRFCYFFFSALHKVLTHVANGCRLVIYAHYSPF